MALRVRALRSVRRVLAGVVRILIVGLSLGIAPPSLVERVLRQDDPVVQVEEAKER